MKYFWILFIFIAALSGNAQAQATEQAQKAEINWITWDQVEAKMATEPRKVLVDVYTKWCGPCRLMSQRTFTDSAVVEYVNANYYAIKFDAEGGKPVTFKGTTYENPGYDPARRGRNATHDLTRAIAPVNGRIAYPTIVYMDENFKILSPVQGYLKPNQIMPILTYFGENIYKTKTWEEYSKGT